MRFRHLSLILLAMLLSSCAGQAGQTAVPTLNLDAGNPPEVQATDAPAGGLGSNISGELVPLQEAELGVLVPSSVERVLVRLGDSVKAGQVLVSLSGREQAQAVLSAAEQAELQARQAFDMFNEGGAAVSSAQAGIDEVAARKVLKDAEERLANLKYQRWLFEVRTKNQIGAMENQLNEKFSNPTDEDLADAEYQVVLAKARLNAASLKSSGMKDGTDPDQQALLQAALKAATDQVAAARAALERLDLKAPFAGEVSLLSVSPGDTTGPGQVLVIVTDSSALLVETTDLSERDVVGLEVGREVSVRVKPLGKTVDGTIIAISSRAESIGGDVVYRTVIELKEIPAGARAGMTVEVGL